MITKIIVEEEAEKGDSIDAPTCPYKLQPDNQGNMALELEVEILLSTSVNQENFCGLLDLPELESLHLHRNLQRIKVNN